jgi:hypothetical protein
LGVQSNILVAAKYNKPQISLTPERIYPALKEVILEHPALSTIGVTQPSEKQKGNHRLWEVHLPVINLTDCVVFINDLGDGDDELAHVFENAHNQWFETQDTTKPWWKLLIYDGSFVVFVYHHSIGDGLSGYTFHRSLLAALNANEPPSSSFEQSTDTTSLIINVPNKALPPYPLDQIDDRILWVYVIYGLLFWHVLRFIVNQKYFLFSDAKFSKTYPTATRPLPESERTITKAKILRFEKAMMSKCLTACRKQNTSFSALLHTLIQVNLAANVYPNAKFGFSRQAVNIRPLLKVDTGKDQFNDAASQYGRVQWLSQFRKAGSPPPTSHSSPQIQPPNLSTFSVNAPLVWKLAAQYKAGMTSAIYKSRRVVQDFIMGPLLGEDIEEVGTFYGMGLYQNNSFLISNLGVFEPREEMNNGGWTVEEVGFSAGSIRASMGDIGPSFNAASVKDGDCVMCATWEQSVLEERMVERVLEGVKARLEAVI